MAAVVESPGAPFEITPRPNEALVRIVEIGLCHIDRVDQAGAFGFDKPVVPGHEGYTLANASNVASHFPLIWLSWGCP